MIRLILVRHAETDSNRFRLLQGQSDGALNQIGQKQARQLGFQLKNLKVTRALTSDMRRARDTAVCIAFHHPGLQVEEKKILREWHVGDLDAQPAETLHQALAASSLPLADFRPEGGETLRELRERARRFLDEIEQNFAGESVLVCSHGDFLRMLISNLQGISVEEANKIRLKNASFSIFEKTDAVWQTVLMNATSVAKSKSFTSRFF